MTDDQVERRVDVVGQGLLCAQALFAGLLVIVVGIAAVSIEIFHGLAIVAAGLVLVWFAAAMIGNGTETWLWNRTIGWVFGLQIDETFTDAAEQLDSLDDEEGESDA